MKKEEIKVLVKNKLEDGKDFPQIKREIDRDISSQIKFKNLQRELKTTIKERDVAEEKAKRVQKQMFDFGLRYQILKDDFTFYKKSQEQKKDYGKCAKINDAKKIYFVMKNENKAMNFQDIFTKSNMEKRQGECKEILLFFQTIGIIVSTFPESPRKEYVLKNA